MLVMLVTYIHSGAKAESAKAETKRLTLGKSSTPEANVPILIDANDVSLEMVRDAVAEVKASKKDWQALFQKLEKVAGKRFGSFQDKIVDTVSCFICTAVANQIVNYPHCFLLTIGMIVIVETVILMLDLGILGALLGMIVGGICRSASSALQRGLLGHTIGETLCFDKKYCSKDRVEWEEMHQLVEFQKKFVKDHEKEGYSGNPEVFFTTFFDAFCKSDFCLGPKVLLEKPKCDLKCERLCETSKTCIPRQDAVNRVKDIVQKYEQNAKKPKRYAL